MCKGNSLQSFRVQVKNPTPVNFLYVFVFVEMMLLTWSTEEILYTDDLSVIQCQ